MKTIVTIGIILSIVVGLIFIYGLFNGYQIIILLQIIDYLLLRIPLFTLAIACIGSWVILFIIALEYLLEKLGQ